MLIQLFENDHILGKAPEPIPNSEAKPVQARLVLPWGTRWESRVSFSFLVPGSGIDAYGFLRTYLHHFFQMSIHATLVYGSASATIRVRGRGI